MSILPDDEEVVGRVSREPKLASDCEVEGGDRVVFLVHHLSTLASASAIMAWAFVIPSSGPTILRVLCPVHIHTIGLKFRHAGNQT